MLSSVSVLLLSAVLLLAMILNLTLKPAWSARLSTACMVTALIGGLLFYGCGYAETTGDPMLSILRTPFSVFRLFVGVNELSAIAGSTLVSTKAGVLVFWLIHLMGFYSMASAAMLTLGAQALRHLRLLLSRRGDLTLIYGIDPESIELGKACLEEGKGSVVFVAGSVPPAQITDLNNQGMSVLTGDEAVSSKPSVLRSLGAGRRRMTVYALEEGLEQNLNYAMELKQGLETIGADPKSTRLTLPGEEDILARMLQLSEEQYGFGYVNVFNPANLTARALIHMCPPWEQVAFGPDGRAQEDYHCAVVGFGRVGQAVLRQLVMNGQFAGGRFRAGVFSPKFEQECGYLLADCPELLRQYEVESFADDGRSRAFYQYIGKNLSTLKLVAVCTGSDDMNQEIADNLMLYLHRRGAEEIQVVQCGHQGVRYQSGLGSPIQTGALYTPELLDPERGDRGAMILNAVYDTSQGSDWDKWVRCSSFNKMSSRASAAFLPAFLRMAGLTREEALGGKWCPKGALLETLGETEHLRWCAFHFANGYVPMSRHQFESNAQEWVQAKAEGREGNIRIAKDARRRTHACLIPWEELDDLSARETALTGRAVDYKQIDRNNVLTLPSLLGAQAQEAKR